MSKITKVSEMCLALIEEFECGGDFRKFLTAYRCPAGRWTIGMGTTRYPDGTLVMPGDVITEQRAYECITHDIKNCEEAVTRLVTATINQHQFDALADFVYNLGAGAFEKSTLLKLVNADPNDPGIDKQFRRWIMANGVVHSGLFRRRQAESWLYFNGTLKFQFP